MKINVTQTFLPNIEEYISVLSKAWENKWITNDGELLRQFEKEFEEKFNVKNFSFVSNGTIAIQIAIRALSLKGEIITTPFSYVATTTSILWEYCVPVFVDINLNDFCIDVSKIEDRITSKTTAILATHVYGFPCDIVAIENIASKYNLKVIYDAAHAVGVEYKNQSIFNYGDISTCSFHATKLFHTGEGGGVFTNNKSLSAKINLFRSFGHIKDEYFDIGINGKNSEFHAAMGLVNLGYFDSIVAKRKEITEIYNSFLTNKLYLPEPRVSTKRNYAYYPVIFESEKTLEKVVLILKERNIFPRRYFYPSLNKLPYLEQNYECSISEDISNRVLALPLYYDLEFQHVELISKLILNNL